MGLLPLLPPPRCDVACSLARFCRTYSVGSKRCLGGALLGRGGRGGVPPGQNQVILWREQPTRVVRFAAAGALLMYADDPRQ